MELSTGGALTGSPGSRPGRPAATARLAGDRSGGRLSVAMSHHPIRAAGTRVEAVDGQQRIRVAVVFGGRSSEHAISCISAGSVLAAIDRDRYEVVPVGIARDGRWVLAPA